MTTVEDDSPYHRAQTTANLLEARLETDLCLYRSTAEAVIAILRDEWSAVYSASFLRRPEQLVHETEEAIIALYHLNTWWKDAPLGDFVAVDVGCGKGYLGMYLSYLSCVMEDGPKLRKIILIDKANEINWEHIETANATADAEGRPQLQVWSDCNLFDYDALIDRLLAMELPLALTGIHLCKMLGPAFCGLVNGLDQRCAFACLAPCCVPRCVSKGKVPKLAVICRESGVDRARRLSYLQRRQEERQCYQCGSVGHVQNNCPVARVPSVATRPPPCYACGQVGHCAVNCQLCPPRRSPPVHHLSIEGLASQADPFAAYCRVLADGFEAPTLVHTAVLPSLSSQTHWNAGRKSVFIVTR